MLDEGNITFLRDVEFGKIGDRVLHMEIAIPKMPAAQPMPAILFFHAGGFSEGTHRHIPILFMANSGYFIASVEYRFSTEAQFPAQLEDAQLAVRWLRANAKEYNVDANQIGAWGESAGAIIAQWLGTMRVGDGFPKVGGYDDVDDSVQAVVSFYGTSDPTLGDRIGKISILHKSAEMLFGDTYNHDPEKFKRGAAVNYVRPDDPPFFIVQGALDQICIPEQGPVMDNALTSAQVPHELIIIQNVGHMGRAPEGSPPADPPLPEVRERAIRFVDRYLRGGILVLLLSVAFAVVHPAWATDVLDLCRQAADLLDEGKVESALNVVNQAIQQDPAAPLGYAQRAEIEADLGQKSAYEADVKKALSMQNPDFRTLTICGAAYQRGKDFSKAIDVLSKSLKLRPEAVGVRDTRGEIYYAEGRYQEALADFNECVRLTRPLLSPTLRPDDDRLLTIFTNRAQCYIKLGQKQLADQDMATVENLKKTQR